MIRLQEGVKPTFLPLEITATDGTRITLPTPGKITHLMFRRFAGCPICNIGLRSYLQDIDRLQAASVQSIVIFHSSIDEVLRFQGSLPIPIIADPDRRLYSLFGVDTSFWSVGDPRTWWPAIKEIFRSGLHFPKEKQNPFVLPADFLIDSEGKLISCKYGKHAADVWRSDELISRRTSHQ